MDGTVTFPSMPKLTTSLIRLLASLRDVTVTLSQRTATVSVSAPWMAEAVVAAGLAVRWLEVLPVLAAGALTAWRVLVEVRTVSMTVSFTKSVVSWLTEEADAAPEP
jgi:hypothetical protein